MRKYGLQILKQSECGTGHIEVRICTRDPDKDHPRPCDSPGESAYPGVPEKMYGLMLYGLTLSGFINLLDDSLPFVNEELKYHQMHPLSSWRLEKMMRTLQRIEKRMTKDRACTPGERFNSLAASLNLTFAVERLTPLTSREQEWRWMSLEEGCKRYLEVIDDLRATALERNRTEATA